MSQSATPLNTYDAAHERNCASGKSKDEAALTVVEDYLDGKPRLRGKKKVSKAERDEAFWSSAFANALPSETWRTEPFTLALVRYFSQERVANQRLLSRIARTLPDTLCYAVRRSGLVLRPDSPRRAELNEFGGLASEIAELCRVLEIFETAHHERIAALELSRACLASLTPFELLIHASLYAFQVLVPQRMGVAVPSEGDEQPTEQEFWDAINELLIWKLATAPEAALSVTQEDVAASIAAHLSPILPLLNFEWVMRGLGCRALGVKGGRSPAQRTLDAKSPAVRWSMAGCSAVVHPAMETRAASLAWRRRVGSVPVLNLQG